MILGEICTRACRFCAVKAGLPQTVDPNEPDEVAKSVRSMDLKYVVITSVARDDLKDEGASHFVQTIHAIRRLNPKTKVEVLIPDFSNRMESIEKFTKIEQEDATYVGRISIISRIVMPVFRERITNDLFSMDRFFVSRFSKKLDDEKNKDRLKERIESYKNFLEDQEKIRLNIDKLRVKTLFRKQIDIRSFINQIWNT